jgi:deoxyribonuclease V
VLGRHHAVVEGGLPEWPVTDDELIELQHRLAREADRMLDVDPWTVPPVAGDSLVIGGCFVAFARCEAGPGHPGDRAWAAAVALRGEVVLAESVVADRVPASYAPGLLARREGPILAAAVGTLEVRPDVLLVDATGRDHPRRAGLALHLGAVAKTPTVGVTHRTLVARGSEPALRRGEMAPLELEGSVVAHWVCTRTGARAVVAHAAWRTNAATAAETLLRASSGRARTPAPLQQARRAAREARAASG